MSLPRSCDIFCTVVDNYGDIGVCWRLARQLAHEYGLLVRLWVDDLHSFGKLCPELDAKLEVQTCRGVEVIHWSEGVFANPLPQPSLPASGPGAGVADLVIEAFACKLPQSYIEAMAACERKPVWINLEYLSAEDWVEGCHQLPSPHPILPLTKYFFFPGFTEKTGGLLIEGGLLERRDAFLSDDAAQAEYWHSLGVPEQQAGELRVSLFSYENAAITPLLQAWAQGAAAVRCLLPEGRAVPQVAAFFGQAGARAGAVWQRGSLTVHVLPFVEQPEYDRLLWACDVNFVRGEDSCVRAQWAARPFIWQIYPQHDGVHRVKLEALRRLYTADLSADAADAVRELWLAWNGGREVATAWGGFIAQRDELTRHGRNWAQHLSANNLALNLLDFSSRVD
ncbi:MAG: elongation factor P maturation arginine rhamnosyltransferase EarP [Sideroxydans sp.]